MQRDNQCPRPRLTQSRDRWLAGVCGGIAEFVGWTPRSVRFLWLTVAVITVFVPAVVAYSLLAVAFPAPPASDESFDINKLRKQ